MKFAEQKFKACKWVTVEVEVVDADGSKCGSVAESLASNLKRLSLRSVSSCGVCFVSQDWAKVADVVKVLSGIVTDSSWRAEEYTSGYVYLPMSFKVSCGRAFLAIHIS